MKRLRDDERGMVIVTAVMLLLIMVAIGLAVLSQVDTQTSQSRVERERESAFNLAEAALSAQTFVLGRRGTGTSTIQHPTSCSTASSSDFFCPANAQLMRSYNGSGQVDFDNATSWKTWVRDDANPTTGAKVLFWDDAYLTNTSWARYDKGGDLVGGVSVPNRHVWVRAEATVRGRTRALIAYVRIEDRPVNFPQYAVLAGSVRGQNNGNKTLVNSTGSPLGVGVRCAQPPPSPNCIDLDPTKGPQLVPPNHFELNIPGNNANVPPDNPAIDSDALQSLEDVAKASGTYYAGCPANPNGDVVVIENATNCLWNNSAPAATGMSKCCNSPTNPGLLVIKQGAVNFGGNIEFYGIVYNANLDNATGTKLIETSGTSAIYGAAIVDGRGGVWAGSSGNNIMYDPTAFANINAVGTAGVVQNTWREIVK
jgi:Tfp pilus assembly protein PilX